MNMNFASNVILCTLIIAGTNYQAYSQIQKDKHVIDTVFDGGYWIHAIDFDQDGDVDIVAAALRSDLKWYENDGSGNFTRQNITDNFDGAWSVHANDVDNDGDLDVVACSADLNEVTWWENRGSNNFRKRLVDNASVEPQSIYSVDLDNDNDIDILAAAWGSKEIFWLENNGQQAFTRHVLDNGFNAAHSVHAADLDNDGDIDILAGGGGKTSWWKNRGNGNFTRNDIGSFGTFFVYAADVNGDGYKDVLRNQRNNGDIDWFKNNSGSNFSERNVHAEYGETWSAAVGDFDLDGDQDIVAAGFVPNKISYWLNDGNENFTAFILDGNETRPRGTAVADFDKDGDDDIAIVTRNDKVIWYEILTSPIVPKSITVLEPNGGEKYEAGSAQTIQWEHTGDIANVKIEYSPDNGSTWQTLAFNAPNNGSYSWSVSSTATENGLIRISASDDPAVVDASNDVFFIVKSIIVLLTPNGGEIWTGGSTQTISWQAQGLIDFIKIEFSTDNGQNWQIVESAVSNTGSYSWTVPDAKADSSKIRVSDATDGAPSDESDATFQVEGARLTLLTPNGPEAWPEGSTQKISWTSYGQINEIKIEYSLDNGANWVTETTNAPNNGSYFWQLPHLHSTTALVRISDAADGAPSDVSDDVFTILGANLTLISPNGGEAWYAGSTHEIVWLATGSIDSVQIEYSPDNGTNWASISTKTPNNGKYLWSIAPDLLASEALVRISDAQDGTPADTSNGSFVILQPELSLISPDGGEMWFGGSTQMISWTWQGPIDSVKIDFSQNNGANWTTIAAAVVNAGSYPWLVPEIQTDSAKVRISRASDGFPLDESQTVFTIEKSTLALSYPNGNEILLGGMHTEVKWNTSGAVDSVKIEFSADNGGTWSVVKNALPNTSRFNWQVPNVKTNQARLIISDAKDGTPKDTSDAVFSIINSSLTITAPNGGEVWNSEEEYFITWHSTGVIEQVKLEFTLDNGKSWQLIADNLPNNGRHPWTVPVLKSDSARVRISDVNGVFPPDVSDEMFKINMMVSDVSVDSESDLKPEKFELFQNFPNPFNLETKIQFAVPEASDITLTLFNTRGEKIATLYQGHLSPGIYSRSWDGRDQHGRIVASGLYLYKIQMGDQQIVKKLMLVK
ncbi:MAG: FG-GAP-like repeat-containing protein [bacterium]